MSTRAPEHAVEPADIARARAAVADVARHTPVLPSLTLSERAGAQVVLKAENLQRTGSFKLRGALNKLAALGERCARGVTAGSAGNHAWACAQAARSRGVPCEVFMPVEAPLSKVEGCRARGAHVHIGGGAAGGRGAHAPAPPAGAGLALGRPRPAPAGGAG